jgi:hypothetical protein
MTSVAEAVDSSSPLALLELVSAMASIELRPRDPFARSDAETGPTYVELLDTFMEVSIPETSAILAVAAATHPDELLRVRVKRELVDRRHKLPGWLRQLDFAVTGVERTSEPFGDGEDLVVGVRIGTSYEFCLIVYVDHQAGSVVKDAFAVDQSLTDTMLAMRNMPGARDLTFTSVDRADARARLEDAVAHGAMLWPPFETETWPALRPLLSWALAAMPSGGSTWQRPDWSDEERTQLTKTFLASPHARGLGTPVDEDIVGTLVWYGTDYGPGDPLRWSPVSLEILLLDWIPRKIVADQDYLERIPDVLRAFIPFAHGRAGLDQSLTNESIQALDGFIPAYREAISAPRRQGPEAILERMGALPSLDAEEEGDDLDIDEYMLTVLAEEVGTLEDLWSLDDRPLPDESFDAEEIPSDIVAMVDEVRSLLDGVAVDLGIEFRTACRRLLRDIAVGDPQIFRRKSSPARTAAAIAWMGARANEMVGYRGALATQDLLAMFGVKGSVSQRAEPMQFAIGINPHRQYGTMKLGTARYLTSARRGDLIRLRDHYEARRIAAESPDES